MVLMDVRGLFGIYIMNHRIFPIPCSLIRLYTHMFPSSLYKELWQTAIDILLGCLIGFFLIRHSDHVAAWFSQIIQVSLFFYSCVEESFDLV
jgi:ABC-type nitrate/sulfonate/bicarbonate transport system permease component